MNAAKDTHYHVAAELVELTDHRAIMLTQATGLGEDDCIMLNPVQLRHLAERFAGLPCLPDTSAAQVIALSKRLRLLASHLDDLRDYMVHHSDHKHADLIYELAKVANLSDMAEAFCIDLPDEVTGHITINHRTVNRNGPAPTQDERESAQQAPSVEQAQQATESPLQPVLL